jgi:hypothetical protein
LRSRKVNSAAPFASIEVQAQTGAAVVYVGPSLRRADREEPDPRIDYRPPIKRGDLPAAVAAGYRFIGIVDGEFYQTLAVSPKEILAALQEGCEIVGGASMGALRAAELEPYGMTGVGQIYRWFHRGEVTRDDDVAVSYGRDDGNYWLLTVPMVNVKWVIQDARAKGWLSRSTCGRVTSAARRIYWEQRTWTGICAAAKLDQGETASLLEYVKDADHDLKRLDALATIRYVQARLAETHETTTYTPTRCSEIMENTP